MPNIERREFLKLVGAGGVGAGAGFMLRETIKHPAEYLIPHVMAPEEYSTGIATWYNSVCSMCAAGCGISVRTREGRAKKIEGNPSHPVNQGRLCALGQSGLQVLYNPERLGGPLEQTAGRGCMSFAQITCKYVTPFSFTSSISQAASQMTLEMQESGFWWPSISISTPSISAEKAFPWSHSSVSMILLPSSLTKKQTSLSPD